MAQTKDQVGDAMQSSLSRVSEFVAQLMENEFLDVRVPYEVRMAALEGLSHVADWTELRRKDPPSQLSSSE